MRFNELTDEARALARALYTSRLLLAAAITDSRFYANGVMIDPFVEKATIQDY